MNIYQLILNTNQHAGPEKEPNPLFGPSSMHTNCTKAIFEKKKGLLDEKEMKRK